MNKNIVQCWRCSKYVDKTDLHTCRLKKVKIFWKEFTMEQTVKNIDFFTKWGNPLNLKKILWANIVENVEI